MGWSLAALTAGLVLAVVAIVQNRRTAEGKTRPEVIRCLKRYLAREIYTRSSHRNRHHRPPTKSLTK